MIAKKRKSVHCLFSAVLSFLLIFSFSTFAFSQERGEERNKITLEKNARQNGYQIIETGDGKFKIKILGATNPQNGKKLDGKFDLAYRCKLIAGLIVVSVILAKGYAEEKLRCRFKDDPYLYY